MKKAPDSNDLRFAAEWLREYEDSHEGGLDSLRAAKVADWLEARADAADIREVAREQRVPVAKVRAAVARVAQPDYLARLTARAARTAANKE